MGAAPSSRVDRRSSAVPRGRNRQVPAAEQYLFLRPQLAIVTQVEGAGVFWMRRQGLGNFTVTRRADLPTTASVDAALFANHSLFRDLGADIHERLRAYAKLRSFKRGDVVFLK